MDPAARGAICGGRTMLGDAQGHGLDFDLWHEAWRRGERLPTLSPVGTPLQGVTMAAAVEPFRWQPGAPGERVSGLASASAWGGIVGPGWFGRFDQIGGRRFGGGGGILACLSQLFLDLCQAVAKGLDLGLEGVDLSLQVLAVGTRLFGFAFHAKEFYNSAANPALPP